MSSSPTTPGKPGTESGASAAKSKTRKLGGSKAGQAGGGVAKTESGLEASSGSANEATRVGKDELNLVEYPWASFGKRTDCVIYHEWEARDPATGKAVTASWRAESSPELGLPTAADLRMYLVLMELTRTQGFTQTVHFTRYDLIKRLGWPHNQKSYNTLFEAFRRLRALTISAQNSFWDTKARAFRDVVFGIIDTVEIVVEKGGRKSKDSPEPSSYFKWNDVIHASFQSGYMRTFDLDFALSLKGDVALSLYRYLGKKAFGGRRSFEIELEALHQRHLGLAPTPYASKIKERLDPAHAELQERGFIESVSYEQMKTKKAEKVCYSFPPETLGVPTPASQALPPAALDAGGVAPDLLSRMLALKVSPEVACELMRDVPLEMLTLQLDCLADRSPRNRAATFVKAVRQGWEPPPKYLQRVEAQERAENDRTAQVSSRAHEAQERALTALQRVSEDEASSRLDADWENLDPETRSRLDAVAVERLGVLGFPGRAPGALAAMRRNLLRDWLARETTQDQSDHPANS